MKQEKEEKYRRLLNERKNMVTDTLQKFKNNEAAKKSTYSPSELSNYDNHPAELGSELFQLGMNNALKAQQERELQEIESALKRIEDKSYGQCELCAEKIEEERLEVLPQARTCIKCENERLAPHEDKMRTRPVEEKVTASAFGRKYLNKREDDEHEGMDYLNDLMKYGSADSPQDLGGYRDYKNFYNNEEDDQGKVDVTDTISNKDYKRQLPD